MLLAMTISWPWSAPRAGQGIAMTCYTCSRSPSAWLERTNAEMCELFGRARHARAGVDDKARW